MFNREELEMIVDLLLSVYCVLLTITAWFQWMHLRDATAVVPHVCIVPPTSVSPPRWYAGEDLRKGRARELVMQEV